MGKSHVRSIAVWTAWLVFGVAFEVWDVLEEKKTGDIPLTRLVRDRLMKSRIPAVAWVVKLGFGAFWMYLLFHWLGQVAW